jgi:galactokinase
VGIVAALDHLYNKGTMPAKEMAVISQFAENEYMGKDSGLLDQLSCAYGGLIAIDFCEAKNPEVSPIPFDFEKTNHRLIVTDVRSDHSDLTADYVAIKSEMQEIASFFNKKVLREISLAEFEIALPQLHKIVSERALIRAYHFFFENQRVDSAKEALIKGDFEAFKRIVTASGQSSFNYLQNIYSAQNPTAQASALALCIAQKLLDKCGAWRVHGGGFGGTIQAYVPEEKVEDYCAEMDRIFGKNCCFVLKIRNCGPIKIQ